MGAKTWRLVMQQRALESKSVVHVGLALLMAWGLLLALLGRRAHAIRALSQVHRTTRIPWFRRLVEPYILANRDATYRNVQLLTKPDLSPLFGKRLMVLKPPLPGGEKGVLFVMVNDTIRLLHTGMNLSKLLNDFTLVFEPSWSSYCHPDLLEYTRWSEEIFVLSAEENDFAFLGRLGANLVPVSLGPCDWVDPRAAVPYLDNPKEYDIVMNSNWGPWKRHYVLFDMLRRSHKPYKAALIGSPWFSAAKRSDIERLVNYYGVASQVAIFDSIPYQQVMDITCRSRVSVLLSLKEGSNRAIAESIFCNVPALVLSNHVGGIRKNIVPETGVLADQASLESAIDKLIESGIRPREWGLEHVSCFKSTEILNSVLREHALRQGRPWTVDIAARSNSPESSYVSSEDKARLSSWNEELKDYLR